MPPANLSSPERIGDAVTYAASAHVEQFRKRGEGDKREQIRYLSHLLGVASIVMEDLGTDDDVIAGLLHDVLDDQDPDKTRAADIETRFGADVLAMVEAASGPKKEDPGMLDFKTRKAVYLRHLAVERNAGAIRVSLADKVHNARSTVNDLEAEGASVWKRFNAGYRDQLWWYGSLADVSLTHAKNALADQARAAELVRLVKRMADFPENGLV